MKTRTAFLLGLAGLAGCAADANYLPQDIDGTKLDGKEDSSAVAVFVDMEFDGELLSDYEWNPQGQIESQLFYTVGQLNGDDSIARLDRAVVTNVSAAREGEKYRIRYHARLPVAWGKRNDVPTSYRFKLPLSADYDTFFETYKETCLDSGAHDADAGIMWYYYRPDQRSCSLAAGDILDVTATVATNSLGTTGKYPEYTKIWEDDALRVVAIFGKYEDGATDRWDAGISAYNEFVSTMQSTLRTRGLTTSPERITSNPGVETPDITFNATLPDGKTIEVVALLVDNIRQTSADFNERYEALTQHADLIAYNGHAGLGDNVRALAQKGTWTTGQYSIIFINGCDTYTYVDDALNNAHANVNSDDPKGTKYLDLVMNAMPAYFSNMADGTVAFIDAFIAFDEPKNYEQIFREIDSSQVVLVAGEQDNAFVPGGGDEGGGGTAWSGLSEGGNLRRNQEVRFETPSLAAGRYSFAMTGTGDSDLYVRVGTAPSTSLYDCRPYKSSSNETCEVTITTPAPVHVMVRGYNQSSFQLVGRPL